MPSPFPGMDPYLEDPAIWPSFHATFIPKIATHLNRHIRPAYFAVVEKRVYVTNRRDAKAEPRLPDVAVYRRKTFDSLGTGGGTTTIEAPIKLDLRFPTKLKQLFVVVRRAKSKAPVTVIELLSPTNKARGSGGRKSFLLKKRQVLRSDAHWMELDFLRAGEETFERPPVGPVRDYAVFCARAERRSPASVWPFDLDRPMPTVGVPLGPKDRDCALPLQDLFSQVYDDGAFDALVEYDEDPAIPLSPTRATWAHKLLKAAKLR